MAACCSGDFHTVILSNDGTLHSFGYNHYGQLALVHNKEYISIPTPIPNLPQISMISCGCSFTVCVDCEGFMCGILVQIIQGNSEQETKQISMFLKKIWIFLFFELFLWICSQIGHHNRFRFMVI